MKRIVMKKFVVVSVFAALLPALVWGQKDSTDAVSSYENRFIRPLVDVLQEIEQRFGVRLKFDPADLEGKMLTYADFRIRPYSLDETLQNVFSPAEFKFERQKKRTYKVKPYEYYRRTPADGEKLLAWLHGKYHSREEWEARRSVLKSDFRRLLGIDPLLVKSVDSPRSFKGKVRKYDGYTVQNFALETLPGLYVCGSIYAPTKRRRHSLIMMPVGHWADARYNPDMQYRFAALARAGAVCVSFDLAGWGESEMQLGKGSHNTSLSQPLQCLWGVKILDWILADRKDIDKRRIGVCGGSGGGTLSVFLTLLDERYTAAAPAMSFTSHFDGGCPCESGMGTTRAAGGSCNAELAAVFAPKPMLVISDGGDWTASVPTLEYPFLQDIYDYYGAKQQVRNVHFPDERHQFTPAKRQAVYDFFIEIFGLDGDRCDESRVTLESPAQLQMFGGPEKFPEGSVFSLTELKSLIAVPE